MTASLSTEHVVQRFCSNHRIRLALRDLADLRHRLGGVQPGEIAEDVQLKRLFTAGSVQSD